MSKQKSLIVIVVIFTLLVSLATNVSAASGDTVRVSVASDGTQGNNISNGPSISADGRYIAFTSSSNNLVPGDTNGVGDVFVYDRNTQQTTRISVNTSGIPGNNASYTPSISADGRYIAFISLASNLISGDTNGVSDVFVYDRILQQTERVSVGSSGNQGNNSSAQPAISSDGRYVAFTSIADNLVSGDTNSVGDVFLHDRTTGQTTRISLDSSGNQGDHFSRSPSISSNGQYIAFISYANNLVSGDTSIGNDAFLHDRITGETTLISVNSSGIQGNGDNDFVSISADGRYIVIESNSTNLVPGDSNGLGTSDIFVHDRITRQTILVSVSSNGAQGNDYSAWPFISSDGRYITFYSRANNLVADDTNGVGDIFVHDRILGNTIRVSINSTGAQGNNDSALGFSISSNGRFIAFSSSSTNLVAGDTNNVNDIFVHEPNWNTEPAILPTTGFPKGQITALHHQPTEKAYTNTDLILEIPTLNKKILIVGVPQNGDSWDVTWLGNNAGWLNGSAFPTWNGNTVLTGHVWDAYNQPGSFANLKSLKYDDQILIHAFGQTYTYEVRENSLVTPKKVQAVMKHEELDWVTLITCEFYNPVSENYLFRRMVKAVLVSVK